MAKLQSKDFVTENEQDSPKERTVKDSWAQTTPDLNYGFTLKHALTLEDPDGIDLFQLGCYLGWKAKPCFQLPTKVVPQSVHNIRTIETDKTGDTTPSQEVQKGPSENNKDSGDHEPEEELFQTPGRKISKQLTSDFMKSYSETEMFLAKWLGGDVLSTEEPAGLPTTVLATVAEKDEIVQPNMIEAPNIQNGQEQKADNVEENNKEGPILVSETEKLIALELPNKVESENQEPDGNEKQEEKGSDSNDKQSDVLNQINYDVMEESCASLLTYTIDHDEQDENTLEESSSTVSTEDTITGELSELETEIQSDYDDNLDCVNNLQNRAESIICIKYCCDRANQDGSCDRFEYENDGIYGESEYCLWDDNMGSPDVGPNVSAKRDICSSVKGAKLNRYTSAYSQEQNCFVQILDELRSIKEDIQRQASKQNKTQEEFPVKQSSSKVQSVNNEQVVSPADKQFKAEEGCPHKHQLKVDKNENKISIEINEKCDNCQQKQVLHDYIQIMKRIQKRLSDGTSEYRALEDINLISHSQNILEPLMRMRESNKDTSIDDVLKSIMETSTSSKSVSSGDSNVSNRTKDQEMAKS